MSLQNYMTDTFVLRRDLLRYPSAQYVFALLMLALATGARLSVNPLLGDRLPTPFYFVAVVVISLTCNRGPAILALLGSTLLLHYFLPYGGFSLSPQALLVAALYLATSSAIVYAGQSHRRSAQSLQQQKDWLHTTLRSIGDAVISTDVNGRITLMNEVAEGLTGWSLKEANGKSLTNVFRIINERTHETVENPVDKVRRLNRVVGLANHTILINKSGQEVAIDDSGAPIYGPDGTMMGVILVFRDVGERRATERAVARLAAIVEFSGDAILTQDLDGLIQTWNSGAERLFGHRVEDIIGKPITVLIPPDRLKEEDEIVQHLRQGQPIERLDTVRVAKDGRHIRVSLNASPIKDAEDNIIGTSKVIHDVSELAASREALMQQARLLELTSDAIIVRSEQGHIASWNKGAQDLYGWTLEDAVGTIAHDLLHTRFPQPYPEIADRVRRERFWQGELVHTCKDGAEVTVFSRWVQASAEKDAGDVRSILEINTDITRRKQLEDALRSNERLALAGRLSASIAHEIHNPLDVVGNILFLLDQKLDGDPEVKQLISMGRSEAQRVVEISKNMLGLHRESRTASFINLAELLSGVIALIEETIAKRRRNITGEYSFDGLIEGFPSELRQVFTNVLKNAVEATSEGGQIRVTTRASREAGIDGVTIQVIDDGPGVSEEIESKLFSPFASTKEEGGTGLGLWVSRSIVEKQGGGIAISGKAETGNSGTTVSIFLPLKAGLRTGKDISRAAAQGNTA